MISVSKGNIKYFDDCLNAFLQSTLAQKHFTDKTRLENFFLEAFKKDEMHVALNEENHCIGFARIDTEGMFSKFPYLTLIAVNEEYRSRGIGTHLLQYFEELGYSTADKVFLTVSDFNVRAKNLYEKIGYKEIAVIPDLHRQGFSEHIMMKAKPKNTSSIIQ